MHKDAASATFFSRIFYALIHGFILLIIFTYENSLKQTCDKGEFGCFMFLILKIIAVYLFFTISRFPSFIETDVNFAPAEWEKPPQYYCDICKITPSYRVHHCKKCEKCINLFDHHCFWVGGCIGELNRARFFLYLALESTCVWWIFFSSFSGLIDNSEGYGAFVVAIGVTGVFGVLISSLGTFHFYLISAGSTTWEFLSRYKITYFKPYPQSVNPFSEGFFKNWKSALFNNQLTYWDLPQPMYSYPFNWCDNEYWVCC